MNALHHIANRTKPLPPLENAISELPPASETAREAANSSTSNPPPEQPETSQNSL